MPGNIYDDDPEENWEKEEGTETGKQTDRRSASKKRNKTLSPHYKGNDEGGYGNAPVSGQFKKGNPGGPGRPKGSSNLESAIRKALTTKLVTRSGAKVLPADALARRAIEKFSAPDPSVRSLEFGMKLFEKFGPKLEDPQKSFEFSMLSETELLFYYLLICKALNTAWPSEIESKRSLVGGIFSIALYDDGLISFTLLEDNTADQRMADLTILDLPMTLRVEPGDP